jgi:hypothetical protein
VKRPTWRTGLDQTRPPVFEADNARNRRGLGSGARSRAERGPAVLPRRAQRPCPIVHPHGALRYLLIGGLNGLTAFDSRSGDSLSLDLASLSCQLPHPRPSSGVALWLRGWAVGLPASIFNLGRPRSFSCREMVRTQYQPLMEDWAVQTTPATIKFECRWAALLWSAFGTWEVPYPAGVWECNTRHCVELRVDGLSPTRQLDVARREWFALLGVYLAASISYMAAPGCLHEPVQSPLVTSTLA